MLFMKNMIVAFTIVMSSSLIAMAQDENDITPLMRAVRDGQFNEVKALLKHGIDLEAKDSWGWTALIYAVVAGDENTVKALLDKGANVNAQSNRGLTPLMAAAQALRDEIVSLLIARGADVKAADKNGNTALSLAARRGRSNTYNLIEKAGATESPGGGPSELDFSSGVVSARPMMLNRPRPAYTEKARDEKFNGIARVRVLVGTDGRVKDAKIIQGLPHGLNEQAIRTAFQALFKPAMKQGHPVEYWAMLDVEFNIR